jgi:hypothetical protein
VRVGYRWIAAALAALVPGIAPAEVLQALRAAHRLPVPGTAAGVRVLAIFARTDTGRPLVVVVRPDRDGLDHVIIGAREPTGDELAMLRRWEGEHDV